MTQPTAAEIAKRLRIAERDADEPARRKYDRLLTDIRIRDRLRADLMATEQRIARRAVQPATDFGAGIDFVKRPHVAAE